jgi:hypothetical protein
MLLGITVVPKTMSLSIQLTYIESQQFFFYEDPMIKKWDLRFNGQERMSHQKHTEAPFSTYPKSLERSRQYNF